MKFLTIPLLAPAFFALAQISALSQEYNARLGLFSGPEFTSQNGSQLSEVTKLTESGFLYGTSTRYNGAISSLGQAVWVADAATGVTSRAGLFSGGEFTNSTSNAQQSSLSILTESGNVLGSSLRYNGTNDGGQAVWVANVATGITTRVGLFSGPEFTNTSINYQLTTSTVLKESGLASGISMRYNGSNSIGQAAWVADAATGVTSRVGLFSGAEFTSGTTFAQFSSIASLTESGLLRGTSTRYGANGSTAGQAAWVADAATGVTTRVGIFTGADYISSANAQSSTASGLTESGYAIGSSSRYSGGTTTGQAAWVADVATGASTRVGLFSGAEFVSTSGNAQTSLPLSVTESGYVRGVSNRYNGSAAAGQAAWVADVATGVTTRVGFFSGAEYTRSDNVQTSSIVGLTESGYAIGSSNRYNLGTGVGQAAWVVDVATGVTTRTGLFSGAEFTRSSDNFQLSTISSITESGYMRGSSNRYSGVSTAAGQAAWLADAATGEITRVGLFSGEEFTASSSNSQSSTVTKLTESGYAHGLSSRYSGNTGVGQAVWVADVATGETTRVGLFSGAEFTQSTGVQFGVNLSAGITESGYLGGYSNRYNGPTATGTAAWVADISTGETTRVGISDAVHTNNTNSQNSTITVVLESGDAYGFSLRYNGNSGQDGQTAWIFQTLTGLQTILELSVRPSDGYAFSSVNGMVEGFAYGYYILFDGEANLGNRAFVWTAEGGVRTLDEEISGGIAQYGWASFSDAKFANAGGNVAGTGVPTNGGQGVFLVNIPEPSSSLLLAAAACGFAFRRRRL